MRKILSSSLALALLLGAAPGCGGDRADESDPCNPLAGGSCLLPWPSSAYLEADPTTVTGYRVVIPPGAMPVNIDGKTVDPAPFARFDGFSPSAVIVVGFPGGVSPDGLPPEDDLAASMAADSPIVLLNMDTGERVPFFAEVDLNQEEIPNRALLIRPMIRLEPASRHVVAIRKSVRAPGGGELPIPAAFQAMLDGRDFDHPIMDKLAPGYPAIFAALEEAGVPRTDLVLAWDFVTASDEMLTSDLLTMRDRALPVLHDQAADLTFTALEDPARVRPETTLRFLVGTYQSPNFLDGDAEDDLSQLNRDAEGKPAQNGLRDANFAAVIPNCVVDTRPVPVIIFGHGLFGNGAEALESGLLQDVANDNCVVFVAGDWIGLTNRNVSTAAFAVNDLNRGEALVDKLGQGVIDFITLTRMVKGPMAEAPEFSYQGEPIIDPNDVTYYGASLGGIMGNVYLAYEPEVLRGVLGVPGGAWSLLFERSVAWPPLQIAMAGAYPEPMMAELLTSILGMAMERFDPITTSARVVKDPLPGTPPKQIFMYEAVGDCLVTNLSTEMVARTMGLPVTGPSLYVPFGLEEATDPVQSGLTIYDEHPSFIPPPGNVPPMEDNGTHGGVHERAAVQRQVRRFLEEGVLSNECFVDGQPAACDCATGACD